MRNHQHTPCPPQHTLQRPPHILRVQRRKALIKNQHVRVLHQRPRNVQSAPLPMRKLPPSLPNHLQHARRHLFQQRTKPQFLANRLRLHLILLRNPPLASHQEVESKRPRQHMILMKLRRSGHRPPPSLPTQRLPVQPARQQQSRLRPQHPAQNRSKRRLPTPRRPLQQNPVPRPNPQTTVKQHRLARRPIAKRDVTSLDQCIVSRRNIQCQRGTPRSLRPPRRLKQRRHLLRRNPSFRQTPQSPSQPPERAIRQQQPSHAQRYRSRCRSRQKSRSQRRCSHNQPPSWNRSRKNRRQPVRVPRYSLISLELLILS